VGGITAAGPITGSQSTESALDESVLDTLEGAIGKETVVQLVGLFSGNIMQRLKDLETIVPAKDLTGLRRVAHDFAGDSASFGAMSLSRTARAMQIEAKAGNMDAFAMLPDLLDQAQSAMAALTRRYGAK
jgi:HPt (histidine-containing phosphotransfer) domain-containing protein